MAKKIGKKCQKEPKFGFPRRHVAEPGEAGRRVVTSMYNFHMYLTRMCGALRPGDASIALVTLDFSTLLVISDKDGPEN